MKDGKQNGSGSQTMTEERARQTKYDLIDAASSEIANIIISETGVEAQTRATCAASSAMLERLDELMLVLEAAKSASCRYENFLHGGAGNGQHVSEIQAAAKNLKMIFARIDNIGSKVAGLHGSVELMEKDVEALVSTMERPGERQQGLQGESNDRLTNKAASALANMRAVGSQV